MILIKVNIILRKKLYNKHIYNNRLLNLIKDILINEYKLSMLSQLMILTNCLIINGVSGNQLIGKPTPCSHASKKVVKSSDED